MALAAMKDIDWAEPVIPYPAPDAAWQQEVFGVMGLKDLPSPYRLVTSNVWLRTHALDMHRMAITEAPPRLIDLAGLITSQEGACRFCWGANRAGLRMMGYPEDFIQQVERDAKLADETDREVMRFCRSLAKSNPRPARQDLLALQRLGHSEIACVELAVMVAATCFANRVSTLLAAAPAEDFERFAASVWARLLRPLIARKMRKKVPQPPYAMPKSGDPFFAVTSLLGAAPAAAVWQHGLTACFASETLPQRTKLLMFAVVAQSLACALCEREARRAVMALGLGAATIDEILRTLASSELDERERKLVPWVRDSVRIDQPGPLQRSTRALAEDLGPEVMLEAVGVAALANSVVRLAMLAE